MGNLYSYSYSKQKEDMSNLLVLNKNIPKEEIKKHFNKTDLQLVENYKIIEIILHPNGTIYFATANKSNRPNETNEFTQLTENYYIDIVEFKHSGSNPKGVLKSTLDAHSVDNVNISFPGSIWGIRELLKYGLVDENEETGEITSKFFIKQNELTNGTQAQPQNKNFERISPFKNVYSNKKYQPSENIQRMIFKEITYFEDNYKGKDLLLKVIFVKECIVQSERFLSILCIIKIGDKYDAVGYKTNSFKEYIKYCDENTMFVKGRLSVKECIYLDLLEKKDGKLASTYFPIEEFI